MKNANNSTFSNEYMLLCGQRLAECRKTKGISQEKLGEMIGSNPKYLSKIEQGKQRLTLDMAQRIAEQLNVRSDYLLGKNEFATHDDELIHNACRMAEENTALNEFIESFKYTFTEVSFDPYSFPFSLQVKTSDTPEEVMNKFQKRKNKVLLPSPSYVKMTNENNISVKIKYEQMCELFDDIHDYAYHRLSKLFNSGKSIDENE